MTAPCSGGCGKTVTSAGMWCSGCWVELDKVEARRISDPPSNWCVGCDTKLPCACEHPQPAYVRLVPIPSMPESNSDLRQQVIHAAYKLACGTKAEQAEALDTLALIVSVLQQETHTQKET